MASTIECRSPYFYEPSVVLAGVAVGLFVLLTGLHIVRMVTTRTWMNVYFVLGGTFQVIGYAARVYSTQNVCNKAAYGVQDVLLRLGPSLMMFTVTATHTDFMTTLRADRFCWVPVQLQHITYTSINFAIFVLQVIGSVMLVDATTRRTATIASDLIIASYVTQMVFWGFILAENTVMGIRLRAALKRATRNDLSPSASSIKDHFPHWSRWAQLFGLAISIIGFGRNLVRLTQLGVAFLQTNEWPSYAFDGYQMVVVMGVWGIFYLPGKCAEVRRTQERYQELRIEETVFV